MLKKYRAIKLCLVTFIFAILMSSLSCSPYIVKRVNSNFEEIRIIRGIARFSFEYISDWKLGPFESQKDYTLFTLHGQSTTWSLLVEPTGKEFLNDEAALEHDFSYWSKQLNFNLIEQSSITVDGVQGTQIIFTYYYAQLPLPQGGSGGPPVPTTVRDIYFTQNGLIWSMEIYSKSEAAQKNNEYYDHLLQTFKILN